MSYSQTLHLKKISSENALFDKPCNDLEVWLKGWDHSDKTVTEQNPKARKLLRSKALNKQKHIKNENRFVVNITWSSVFQTETNTVWNTFTVNFRQRIWKYCPEGSCYCVLTALKVW